MPTYPRRDFMKNSVRVGAAAAVVALPAVGRSASGPAERIRVAVVGLGGREQEAYAFLAERGVNAPAGSFYALEASRRLGLGDTGALRIGLAPYVDDADVDRLLDGLAAFTRS